MEECKHQYTKRLYERGKSWESTDIYKCQDCGMLFKFTKEKVEVKE